MIYKVGDKFTIKINNVGHVTSSGTELYDSNILIIYANDVLVTTSSNFHILLDLKEAGRLTRGYSNVHPNLSSFIGEGIFWSWEKEFTSAIVSNAVKMTKSISVKSSGLACVGPCREFNQWAEPNMKDGSYKCFSCRNRV